MAIDSSSDVEIFNQFVDKMLRNGYNLDQIIEFCRKRYEKKQIEDLRDFFQIESLKEMIDKSPTFGLRFEDIEKVMAVFYTELENSIIDFGRECALLENGLNEWKNVSNEVQRISKPEMLVNYETAVNNFSQVVSEVIECKNKISKSIKDYLNGKNNEYNSSRLALGPIIEDMPLMGSLIGNNKLNYTDMQNLKEGCSMMQRELSGTIKQWNDSNSDYFNFLHVQEQYEKKITMLLRKVEKYIYAVRYEQVALNDIKKGLKEGLVFAVNTAEDGQKDNIERFSIRASDNVGNYNIFNMDTKEKGSVQFIDNLPIRLYWNYYLSDIAFIDDPDQSFSEVLPFGDLKGIYTYSNEAQCESYVPKTVLDINNFSSELERERIIIQDIFTGRRDLYHAQLNEILNDKDIINFSLDKDIAKKNSIKL